MTRADIARALHEQGYNCAQAVACAFSDVLNADADTVYRIAEGFGGGMGNNDSVCGAVSAAVIIAGLVSSNGINEPTNKQETYQLSSKLTEAFKNKNKTVICRELKGTDTGEMLRSCPGCIEDAVLMVEEHIFGKK